jgi:hypothetical protein
MLNNDDRNRTKLIEASVCIIERLTKVHSKKYKISEEMNVNYILVINHIVAIN